MTRRVAKSARGEEVDFDLLQTKQSIEENKPRVLEVKQREDFVHSRRRSRGRKSVMDRLRQSKQSAQKTKEPKKTEGSKDKPSKKPETTKKSLSKRKIVKDNKG